MVRSPFAISRPERRARDAGWEPPLAFCAGPRARGTCPGAKVTAREGDEPGRGAMTALDLRSTRAAARESDNRRASVARASRDIAAAPSVANAVRVAAARDLPVVARLPTLPI